MSLKEGRMLHDNFIPAILLIPTFAPSEDELDLSNPSILRQVDRLIDAFSKQEEKGGLKVDTLDSAKMLIIPNSTINVVVLEETLDPTIATSSKKSSQPSRRRKADKHPNVATLNNAGQETVEEVKQKITMLRKTQQRASNPPEQK